MKKSKLLLMLVAMVAVVAVVGCGSHENRTISFKGPTGQTASVTVGN